MTAIEPTQDAERQVLSIARSEVLGHELFPMAMAPLEKFMFWDDLPRYPKRFRVACRFEGELDRGAAVKAFAATLVRQPMLLARPDASHYPSEWQLPEVIEVSIEFVPGGFERDLSAKHGAIAYEPSRFWISQEGRCIDWVFDYHHACTDGRGARNFVKELFKVYQELVQGNVVLSKPSRLDPTALLHRHRYSRGLSGGVSAEGVPSLDPVSSVRNTTTWEKIQHGYHFHLRPPRRLRSVVAGRSKRSFGGEGGGGSSVNEEFRQFSLDAETTSALKEKMVGAGVSWNELGLALLFRVLGQWNARGAVRSDHRLRIMVPIDLREYEDRYMPAANRLGFGFVVLKQGECEDVRESLASIRRQMEHILQLRLAVDFLDIFAGCQRTQLGTRLLKTMLPRMGCMTTAVLTTLGDLTLRTRKNHRYEEDVPWVGGMRLASVVGIPPLRPGTSFAAGLTMASGGLHAATVGARDCLGGGSRELTAMFQQAWIDWLEDRS